MYWLSRRMETYTIVLWKWRSFFEYSHFNYNFFCENKKKSNHKLFMSMSQSFYEDIIHSLHIAMTIRQNNSWYNAELQQSKVTKFVGKKINKLGKADSAKINDNVIVYETIMMKKRCFRRVSADFHGLPEWHNRFS